jgi:adenylate cyclase
MTNEIRKLAAIMFTDIVGYSALSQKNEALALELLMKQNEILRPLISQFRGNEIKTIGDAFLVEFESALEAVNCALEMQKALREYNISVPSGRNIQIRIGIHVGDVVHRDNDVFGDGVNIAARVEPLAKPGGICVTEDVFRQIQNKTQASFVRLGKGSLKNIQVATAIYRIVLPWEARRFPFVESAAFYLRKRKLQFAISTLAFLALAGLVWFFAQPARDPALPPAANQVPRFYFHVISDTSDIYLSDYHRRDPSAGATSFSPLDDSVRITILDDLLPIAISACADRYAVTTQEDLLRSYAGRGLVPPAPSASDELFQQIESEGTILNILRPSSTTGNTDLLVLYFGVLGDPTPKVRIERVKYSDLRERTREHMTGLLQWDIRSRVRGYLKSVNEGQLLVAIADKSDVQKGMILDVFRTYAGGLEQRLEDLNEGIRYYRQYSGFERELTELLDRFESEKEEYAGSSTFALPLGVHVQIIQVFDTTALAKVIEKQSPWVQLRLNDYLVMH